LEEGLGGGIFSSEKVPPPFSSAGGFLFVKTAQFAGGALPKILHDKFQKNIVIGGKI